MPAAIPGFIENTLADFAAATRAHAIASNAGTDRRRIQTLRAVYVAVDAELAKAREEGGRIALGYSDNNDE